MTETNWHWIKLKLSQILEYRQFMMLQNI